MHIERLTVKLLRSGRSYSNDTIELSVTLDDEDDWKEIEPRLRDEAVELIAQHWREVEAREEEERRRRAEEAERAHAARVEERNKYLSGAFRGDARDDPCGACEFSDTCNDCPYVNNSMPF